MERLFRAPQVARTLLRLLHLRVRGRAGLRHCLFPLSDPTVATVLALATFGVAYLACPLGALVFGHFGDRLGRRRVLLATLVLMGASSLAIGLLPTYATVGALAPVLLVVCRLVQGISAGGEAAGASTLTLEYAPEGRRGFFTSFAMSGFAAGMVLATLVFLPVAALPRDALLTWGWRIPFLLSAVVVLVAYFIRRRLDETPVFTAAVDKPVETPTLPLVTLLREQWRDLLRVVGCSVFAVFQTLFAVFALSVATSGAGPARSSHHAVDVRRGQRGGDRRDPHCGPRCPTGWAAARSGCSAPSPRLPPSWPTSGRSAQAR